MRAVGAAYFDRATTSREVLAKHAKSALTRGVRNFPAATETAAQEARGATGSMDDPKWRDGYALLQKYGFSFDLQTPWWHFEAAAALARDFPKTQIIIVHAGLPADRSEEALAAWRAALETVAKEPNVAIKISGLGPPGPAVDAHRQRRDHPRRDQHLRGRARDVRQQLSGR